MTNNPNKNKQNNWADASSKKIHKWLMGTWKDAQPHEPLGKCKQSPQRNTTTCPLEWCRWSSLPITEYEQGCKAYRTLHTLMIKMKKQSNHFGKHLGCFLRTYTCISHMTLGIYPKETKAYAHTRTWYKHS